MLVREMIAKLENEKKVLKEEVVKLKNDIRISNENYNKLLHNRDKIKNELESLKKLLIDNDSTNQQDDEYLENLEDENRNLKEKICFLEKQIDKLNEEKLNTPTFELGTDIEQKPKTKRSRKKKEVID